MDMSAIWVMWHKPFVFTFNPPSHGGATWNLASICLWVSMEKKFENVESEWPWKKVNEWPWPLIFMKLHVLISLTASNNFDIIDYNSFWKIHCFTFFPYKSIMDQIWPCRKIDQGQHRVIIWTNLVVLEYPMLHTNFQGHQLFGSREDFLRFLPYMGTVAILVMWPGPYQQTFVPPSHGGSTWNLASIGPAVSKEKKFEMLNLCDFGPKSMNDLHLWYSYRFMYSFS